MSFSNETNQFIECPSLGDGMSTSNIPDLSQKSHRKAATSDIAADQDSESNSVRSSLDFSFSSLQISAVEWEAIDRETSDLLLSPTEPRYQRQQRSEYGTTEEVEALTQKMSSTTITQSVSVPGSRANEASETIPVQDATVLRQREATTSKLPMQTAHDGAKRQAKYKFSPSVLAHHANTACEKMLHLKGSQLLKEAQNTRSKEVTTDDNNVPEGPSAVSEANMERGIFFESRLQGNIKDKIDCGAENDKDSFFRLATTPIGTTLCQPIFSLDEGYYTKKMKQAGIVFGRFIPDFIRILPGTPVSSSNDGKSERKRRLFIIDAKSSSHVKISHQFQVTLYSIFLDHLIKLHKQEDIVEIDPRGGVWIPSHDEPRTFSLTFMRPIVENFIYKELPEILMKPLRSAVWHIDSPCLQCEFLPGCELDAVEQQTLSVIPLLSKKSAIWIKSLFKTNAAHKTDIDDIEDLFRNRASLSEADRSSLSKILHEDDKGESVLLTVHRQGKLRVFNTSTMDLPQNYQNRLLITILTDHLTQMPFAYSLEMFKEQSIRPSRSYANAVTYSSLDSSTRLSSHIRLAQELIDTLYEWLVQISEIQPRPPVLSIFFYNQAMQSDLQKLLLKVLTASTSQQHQRQDHEWSSVTKNRSMDLLCNLYEDSSFLTLSEFTGNANIKLPDLLQLTQGFKNQNLKYDKRLFMIEKAVQKLVVLPVLGPYSFKDIMTKLVDVRIPALINERDRDDDGYNLNSIFERWTSGANEDDIKKILGKWTEQQNLILIGLYGLLRHELSDFQSQMMAPQAPFKMRSHFNFQHHILAQFAFFQQWEAIMVCGKRRATRASLSRFEAMQRQFLFRCRFLGRHVGPFPGAEQGKGTRVTRTPSDSPFSEYIGKFEITSRIDPGALIASTFKNWILSPDCDSGLKNRLRFDDLCAYLRAYGMGSPSIVSINHYDTNSGTIYIGGTFKNMTEILALTEGEHYLLERREFSPTLAVSMDKLVEMDGNCRLFMELMDDPNKWGLQRPDRRGDVFIESITNGARQYDMTLSQEQAFSKVINNRLQIIWGPPGSGKTHFLALTVLRFIDILRSLASKGKGQGPQTIVLTAFTHSAIDNIVERVAKLHNQIAPHVGFEDIVRPLSLYRLGDPSTLDIEGARVVEPQDLVKLQARSEDNSNKDIIRVVCGTVWQVRRAAHPKTGGDYMRNVQMVIIDEGSQLLAADSIHVIECLDPKYGRLIVAGDHLQLGPVIVGDYPESERVPDPTGSIMKNLMRKTNNTPVSLQWVEDAMVMDIGPCTSQLQENFRM
ncbi:Tripartite DNA replication factor, partial [Lobosporangium transversale]